MSENTAGKDGYLCGEKNNLTILNMNKQRFFFVFLMGLLSLGMMAQEAAYKYRWSADKGDGTYVNPIVNADFPDPDVIRVGDTYYMVSTTMYYFPGATILQSKDLVNWEYCANPLKQILNNDAYNLANGKHHYAQGMWASSLSYHDGKFYLYFPCSAWSEDSQSILLTATDPEGEWKVTLLSEAYHDPGWLFDDGEHGDGNLYVACGIGDIYVNKLDTKTFKKLGSTKVLSVGNGCEGSHMYHIGDYYYIYATYGGTEGSQTIFRSKNPMGPYEEHEGRVFAHQNIHQGALVQTQTGEWWTILFRDIYGTGGSIGRIPCLEPVKWENGWPIIGNNGVDVSKDGASYPKPNVGATYEKTYLPTNDAFTDSQLGLQWEWNHNPDNSAWSLTERLGWLRLHTANVTDELNWAHNSLSQRILGFSPNGTQSNRYKNSYGTVKMDLSGMQEGDVAGIAVFQNPYSFIGIKVVDGKKKFYAERCTFGSQTLKKVETKTGAEVTADVVYLRAIVNFGTNSCKYSYSYDNEKWTSWGVTMTMGYTLDYFVGQRFYLFNYATKHLGGYVDFDWFSTEQEYSEEAFGIQDPSELFTEEDMTMESFSVETTDLQLLAGNVYPLELMCTAKSGLVQNVAARCTYEISNATVATVEGGRILAARDGTTDIKATYTDMFGHSESVTLHVVVSSFPLKTDDVNPSLFGEGTYTPRTCSLKTAKDGLGGWRYPSSIDISGYNYLVIKFLRSATCNPSFRLFDQDNTRSSSYHVEEIGRQKMVAIDLRTLKTSDGKTIDPAHICLAAFSTDGTAPIYISEIFLSNDGTTDATGIEAVPAMVNDGQSTCEIFTLDGKRLPALQRGVNIVKRCYANGTVDVKKVYLK